MNDISFKSIRKILYWLVKYRVTHNKEGFQNILEKEIVWGDLLLMLHQSIEEISISPTSPV